MLPTPNGTHIQLSALSAAVTADVTAGRADDRARVEPAARRRVHHQLYWYLQYYSKSSELILLR